MAELSAARLKPIPASQLASLAAIGDNGSQLKRRVLRLLGAEPALRLTRVDFLTLVVTLGLLAGVTTRLWSTPTTVIDAVEIFTENAADANDSETESEVSQAADESVLSVNDKTRENTTTEPSTQREQVPPDRPSTDHQYEFSGTVVDPDGEPVPGAVVRIIRTFNTKPYEYRSRVLATLTSDNQGKFQTRLNADQVPVEKKGLGAKRQYDREWIDLIASKPGFGFAYGRTEALDPDHASPESLGWIQQQNQPAGQVLTLVADNIPLQGRLLNTEGQPIAGAKIRPVSVWTGKDGTLDALKGLSQSHDGLQTMKFRMWFAMHPESISGDAAFNQPVVTDKNGRFVLQGLGRNRVAELLVQGPDIETTALLARTEAGEAITVAAGNYLGDTQIHPAQFEQVLGPSIPAEGTITDIDTGTPLAGIIVKSAGLPGWKANSETVRKSIQTRTDAEGHYRLEGLPLGKSELIAIAPPEVPYLPLGRPITLKVDQKQGTRNLQLKRGLLARGRAIDSDTQRPVVGVVEYSAFTNNPALEKLGDFSRSYTHDYYRTDSEGRYAIPVLPGAGILAFTADDSEYDRGAGLENIEGPRLEMGTIPVFDSRPSMLSLNKHRLVGINPSAEQTELLLDLPVERLRKISGRVVNHDGQPVEGCTVHNLMDYAKTGPDGSFELTLRDAASPPMVVAIDFAGNLAGVAMVDRSTLAPLEIHLQPAATIRGQLVDASGLPLQGAELDESLNVRTPEGVQFVQLAQASGPPLEFSEGGDGRFELRGLLPGMHYSMKMRVLRKLADFPKPVPYGVGPLFKDVTLTAGEVRDLGTIVVGPDGIKTTPRPEDANQNMKGPTSAEPVPDTKPSTPTDPSTKRE